MSATLVHVIEERFHAGSVERDFTGLAERLAAKEMEHAAKIGNAAARAAAYREKGAGDGLRVVMRNGAHCLSREALDDAADWLRGTL
jgi:hypothetical protein